MLYHFHELSRSLMSPLVYWSEASARMFSAQGSYLSHLPGAPRIAAGYELLYRIGKDYEKPEFGIRSVTAHGHAVPIVEIPVLQKPFCNLLRFKRFSDDAGVIGDLKDDPVVLVVAPLSGHHSTLLRDTVRTLLQDHKVYITDWKNARLVPLSAQHVPALADAMHDGELWNRYWDGESWHAWESLGGSLDPTGQPFNPELHEAMVMQESPTVPPNNVVQVIQTADRTTPWLTTPGKVIPTGPPIQFATSVGRPKRRRDKYA